MKIAKIFLILLGALTLVSEGQKPPSGPDEPIDGSIPTPEGDVAWPFGLLNDISLPAIGKRYPSMKGNFSTELVKMFKDGYKQNAFAGTGPYRGIVLRDDTGKMPDEASTAQEDENIPAESWIEVLNFHPVLLRVRVPEIHAMLPIPTTVGSEAGEEDNKIIDMYDLFSAQSDDQTRYPPMKVGDIVWVDWGNKQNWTDPFYLGPVKSPNNPGGGGGSPPNSAGAHDNPCGGGYQRTPSSGDSLAGSNVSLKPYQGLPRLERSSIPKTRFDAKADDIEKGKLWDKMCVVAKGDEHNEVALEGLKKAWMKKGKYELKVFFGHITYNGDFDARHNPKKRSTMIVAPWYIDTNKPWELIYWFHGLDGFSQKNFEGRMLPQINKMIKEERNFILVKPELPWSISGTGKFKGKLKEEPQKGVVRQTQAWHTGDANVPVARKYGGNFALFHYYALTAIHESITSLRDHMTSGEHDYKKKLQKQMETGKASWELGGIKPISLAQYPSMISIFGHSNGGSAIARAAQEGALTIVEPDRLFFSDSDYSWGYPNGGAVGATWKHYIKDSKKKIWLTMLTIPNHTPRKQAIKFFAKTTTAAQREKHYVYHITTTKSHAWCGHNALGVVAKEHAEAVKKEKEAAAKPTPTPPKPETEENKVEEQAAADAKAESQGTQKPDSAVPESPTKPKPGEGAKPPPQGAAAPASTKPKQSTTADPPKPNFKTAPAVPYKENRVRVKDYGGTIKGANNKLLVSVGNGKKAHVLIAQRWEALKKAAIAAGLPDVKVGSGWRAHKWKSRAHYEQVLIKEYGSVSKGKAYRAYNSPHETGLALDIVGHGLNTSSGGSGSAAKAAQRKKHRASKLGKWLIENAYKFGFTPYAKETWHWECRIPVQAWTSGKEFTDKYAIRVDDTGKPGSNLVGKGGPAIATSTTGGPPCRVGTVGGGPGGGHPGNPMTSKDVAVAGLGKRLFMGPARKKFG